MVNTTTHIEAIIKVTIMANLEAEAVVVVELITMNAVVVGLIIEVITTTNTISIMVMIMTTSPSNITSLSPPCALRSGYNHSPKHCFKGEHDINHIMEKMNIS